MDKNIGKTDKTIRLVVGVVLLLTAVVGESLLIGLIGVVLIATALIGWCPAYGPLKINTCCKDDKCETQEEKKEP